MFRRRPKTPDDWFTCPVCGAEVRVGAAACRECGSDDLTGWSEDTHLDDLDLPEPEIPDTFEEFAGLSGPRAQRIPPLVVVAILFGAVALIVISAVLARL